MKLHQKDQVQENQYVFPYHFLTSKENGDFSCSKFLYWGLVHQSYTEYVVKKILKEAPGNFVDIGCGDGRILYDLESFNSEHTLHGLDYSNRAIQFARAFTSKTELLVHDLLSGPYQKKFDVAVCVEVIEHIKPNELDSFIKNIHLSLNCGGRLILTTPTENLKLSKKHFQHFTESKIRNYFNDYFEIEKIEYLNKENIWSRFLSRVLINKYFILNSRMLKNFIYSYYVKNNFQADHNTGTRILVEAKAR